jgi:hypothetical protein
MPIRDSTGVKENYNTLQFTYGPLIALKDSGSFDGQGLRDLSINIGKFFNGFSDDYFKSKKLDLSNPQTHYEYFGKVQKTHVDWLIKRKIRPLLGIPGGTWIGFNGLNDAIIDSVTYELERSFLSTTSAGLRLQSEKFSSIKDQYKKKLFIELEPNILDLRTGILISFKVTRENLIDMGFVEWGTKLTGSGKTVRDLGVDLMIKGVVNFLDSKITKIGDETGDKKFVFIPIYNTNSKNLGYQVLERSSDGIAFKFLPDSGYFIIDTQNDKNYKKLLDHISKLTLSDACGFVVKPRNDDITTDLQGYLTSDTKIIMAFTKDRIISPEKIFSKSGSGQIFGTFYNYQIKATDYVDYPAYLRPTTPKWRRVWSFPTVWSKGSYKYGNFNSDLAKYMRLKVANDLYLQTILRT